MKKVFLTATLSLLSMGSLVARNTITKIATVNESVTVNTDVDYTITDTEPFGVNGSVNIINLDHAVVIIQKIKPSKVISNYLSHIYINGEAAVNGTNCIVQMYNRGAIIYPYASTMKPLTCYTGENYTGDSYNAYGTGNSGGYMNTLNKTQLNNNIRSFKLKRGYMVTFATGTSGWGYSRCFIADQEDLEIASVPAPLNGKISSYRVFHWYNAHKAGGASSGDATFNQTINSCWCYDWAQGNASLLPDVEWVPNHIYEDYPSSATCGSVTGSCHMKTNNEPGNSSDDHPQSVDVVLNNWQNLMRTGMRLCSESSHDGSWSHLGAFIDSIDARGWRCDLLDLHCYWPAGSFNDFSGYYSKYHNRPIWISEWLWGASWNKNGIFGAVSDPSDFSAANQKVMYDNTKPILDKLNASRYVERYAIWNGEAAASKIYKDGNLSTLGQYYATMDDGLGYNADIQKIPNIVYRAPYNFTGTYTKKAKTVALEWSDPNGDMIDSIVVEHKSPGSSKWVKIDNVGVLDKTSKDDNAYTYTTTVDEVGINYYRVTEYYDGGKKMSTDEYAVTVAAANSVGSLQYGQLKIGSTESVSTDIDAQDAAPYVVTGLVSNKNTANGITNQVQTLAKSSFKFRFYPWALTTPVDFNSAETVDYMILPPDTIYHLSDDIMLISYTTKKNTCKTESCRYSYYGSKTIDKCPICQGKDFESKTVKDETEIEFPEAFPEGVIPVVVAQQNTNIASYAPVNVRVYDITNKGFKVKLTRQEGVTSAFNAQNVNYFACTPGQIAIGNGKLLTVGRNDETPCGGSARQTIVFKDAQGDTLFLKNPYIIAGAQTNNYPATSIFRQHSTTSTEAGVYQASIKRQVDGTTTCTVSNIAKSNGDYIGWMIISDDPNGTGDEEPLITPTGIISTKSLNGFSVSAHNGAIYTDGCNVRAYNAAGQEVNIGMQLPRGMYIVTNGKRSVKIQMR